MLDMGFEPQIKKILLDIRPDRQTVMTRYICSHVMFSVHHEEWQYHSIPGQCPFLGNYMQISRNQSRSFYAYVRIQLISRVVLLLAKVVLCPWVLAKDTTIITSLV